MEPGSLSDRAVRFIVNPVSGNGRTRRVLPRLVGVAKKLGVRFDLQLTEAPQHATELANENTNEFDVVIAVGGDGTVNEVATGAWKSKKVMGVIPTGTGNDFVRAIGRLKSLHEYVHRAVAGKIKAIDVGTVCMDNREFVFVNGVGIGFDAEVARESLNFTRLKGISRYLVSVMRTLSKYKSAQLTIRLDDDVINQKSYLVAIGNGISAGGGFLLTPNAVLDDGALDACIVRDVSIPRVLRVIPSVLRGEHVKLPEVTMRRSSKVNIKSEIPVAVHRDGEIPTSRVTELDITVTPRSLKIIV